MLVFHAQNLEEMDVAALEIVRNLKFPLILLKGEMGSGKTTFTQMICKHLGTSDSVSSPTFSLVNEYNHPKGNIYHLDLYRLNDLEEFLEIGGEDYLYTDDYCFIEWPDMVETILPEQFHQIKINVEQGVRIINFV